MKLSWIASIFKAVVNNQSSDKSPPTSENNTALILDSDLPSQDKTDLLDGKRIARRRVKGKWNVVLASRELDNEAHRQNLSAFTRAIVILATVVIVWIACTSSVAADQFVVPESQAEPEKGLLFVPQTSELIESINEIERTADLVFKDETCKTLTKETLRHLGERLTEMASKDLRFCDLILRDFWAGRALMRAGDSDPKLLEEARTLFLQVVKWIDACDHHVKTQHHERLSRTRSWYTMWEMKERAKDWICDLDDCK